MTMLDVTTMNVAVFDINGGAMVGNEERDNRGSGDGVYGDGVYGNNGRGGGETRRWWARGWWANQWCRDGVSWIMMSCLDTIQSIVLMSGDSDVYCCGCFVGSGCGCHCNCSV